MSVDINWDTLTNGPDGRALAEVIRSFVHDKFQEVELPRFIRAVRVHSFDFGAVGPVIELKDICDPLPDFYEGDDDDDEDSVSEDDDDHHNTSAASTAAADKTYDHTTKSLRERRQMEHLTKREDSVFISSKAQPPPYLDMRLPGLRSTPGIPGGTSNLNYFHLPLSTNISGAQTPLAAVAGAQYFNGRQDNHTTTLQSGQQTHSQEEHQQQDTQMGSPTPPPNTHTPYPQTLNPKSNNSQPNPPIPRPSATENLNASPPSPKHRERHADDFQIVSHVRYSGDVKLSLTASILLDYPMPSFINIPLKLNITGLTFDGIAILAYIRKHAHFSFLSPEDADILVGAEMRSSSGGGGVAGLGGLLKEIKVESEIGQQENNGKQVLKNVGKVERFVTEQVRRIFEDEVVFPSFWTFLV
ncbi:MAG: hypothetical protein M1812_006369 [Candelaria pacifica]|nr:MAG: hypothetical protein M1812_006369 [Candelaria pacifica]